jgi:pyruvate dehydrogenase phosphatase
LAAKSRRLASHILSPAIAGSCALLAFYDTQSQLLRVACTSDSRAVLGRKNSLGDWTATALSVDLDGDNADEVARIRGEHPGEKDVIKNGRIFGGLQPTRTFGDSAYKWSQETSLALRLSFWARKPNNQITTPPYVIANPVITTTKIEPDKGDFVVMASDGLFEMLTQEEVVGLVGKWLTTKHESNRKSESRGWFQQFRVSSRELPVAAKPNTEQYGQGVRRSDEPIRRRQWQLGPGTDHFVVKDENAATHLMRNALGGKSEDLLAGLLALPTPNSRRYR